MKKITLLMLILGFSSYMSAQCLTAVNGQYPNSAYTPPVCDGLTASVITSAAYTDEYSVVNLTAGETYAFSSSVATDYVTISTDGGATAEVYGVTPVTWVSTVTGTVRFYLHANDACGGSGIITRSRKIVCGTPPTCIAPTGVTASGITTSAVTINWTESVTTPSEGYEYYYSENNTAPTAATTASGTAAAGSITVELSGLSMATTYYVWVRSNCGGGDLSDWTALYNFTTACNPIGDFAEDFETTATSTVMPNCWSKKIISNSTSSYAYVSATGGAAAPKSLVMGNSGDATAQIFAITPALTALSSADHRLKFSVKGSTTVTFQVGTMSDPSDESTFTVLDTYPLTSTYQSFALNFDSATTDAYIAFKAIYSSTYYSVNIDDVLWEPMPACPDVSGLTFNTVTNSSANIAWNAGESESNWQYVYGATTVTDPTTLTPVDVANDPNAILSGLLSATSYKFWIRSNCGSGAFGAWIGPLTFTTACDAIGDFTEGFETTVTGTVMPNCWNKKIVSSSTSPYVYVSTTGGAAAAKSLVMGNSGDATAQIFAITPALTALSSADHRLKFSVKGSTTITFEVGTMSDPSDESTFTTIETYALTSTHQSYVLNFDSATTDAYIAFKATYSSTYYSANIDDVVWEPIPACADVTELSFNAVTTSSANIAWTAGGSESNWQYAYGDTTVTDPTALTPVDVNVTNATINGLLSATSYKFWVRSNCGSGSFGAWIGPLTFTTACDAIGDFTEGFEATVTGTVMPNCWNKKIVSPSASSYIYVSTSDIHTGAKALRMGNSDAATATLYAITPGLTALPLQNHRLKFYAMGDDSITFEVGTMSDPSDENTFTSVETFALTTAHQLFSVNFDAPTTDSYVAFKATYSSTYYYVSIDDVVWDPIPACADVTDLTVGALTTSSADIAWNAGDSESNWQYAYGATTVTDPGTLTPVNVANDTNATIDGLLPETSYKFWVRSDCGSGSYGAWMGPVTFATLCNATNVPYLEDFESTTEPNLPGCSSMQNAGDGNDWVIDNAPGYGFTSNTLKYSYDTENAADVWFFTQGLNLTAGTEYSITYRYGNDSEDFYTENLKVMYGTNPTADDMTIDIADHPGIAGASAQTNTVTFTPDATGTYYFGFNAYSEADEDHLFVDDIAIDTTLSVNPIDNANFTFYPNPVKNILNLSYDKTISDVTVFNLLGQQVIAKSVNANMGQIDMSKLSAGTYMVKVTSGDQLKTIKVIKQ